VKNERSLTGVYVSQWNKPDFVAEKSNHIVSNGIAFGIVDRFQDFSFPTSCWLGGFLNSGRCYGGFSPGTGFTALLYSAFSALNRQFISDTGVFSPYQTGGTAYTPTKSNALPKMFSRSLTGMVTVTPLGAPLLAPTITSITSARTYPAYTSTNMEFSINFTIPSSATEIRNYQYTINGGSTWVAFETLGATNQLNSPRRIYYTNAFAGNTTYNFAIRAVNAYGAGPSSNTVSHTTGA
jgi:hypothetical protein